MGTFKCIHIFVIQNRVDKVCTRWRLKADCLCNHPRRWGFVIVQLTLVGVGATVLFATVYSSKCVSGFLNQTLPKLNPHNLWLVFRYATIVLQHYKLNKPMIVSTLYCSTFRDHLTFISVPLTSQHHQKVPYLVKIEPFSAAGGW